MLYVWDPRLALQHGNRRLRALLAIAPFPCSTAFSTRNRRQWRSSVEIEFRIRQE
jgi:hypothetical protein